MDTSKDRKYKETPNRDPGIKEGAFEYGNKLSLPEELKASLTKQALDWRFLNASQFRESGNYHRSNWIPYKVLAGEAATYGATPEGTIVRGDLILGVRAKSMTAKHKEFLKERNQRYAQFNKTEAQKLRQAARDSGLGGHVKVVEGYDGDDED